MLEGRWAHPDWSFYTSFGSQKAGKAAYDFLVNRRGQLHFENLLAPHQHQTRRRMAAESVVLLAQDTTTLSYNTLKATQGLGDIADEAKPGRGLFLHTLQAFRLDRIHLGCAWAKLWARPAVSDTDQRNAQSIDQKESVRWVEAFALASQMARQMPQTTLLVAGDRESDIMDLYDRGTVAPANLFFLVRGQHDRVLENGQKLWDYLPRLPVGGTMSVKIPRNKERPARQATLALRWAPVALRPPRVGCKNSWGTVSLWALMATEVNPPAGAEPIEWLLLTNWPIQDLKTARRLVRWYGLRWGIECWHQVLKDVCRVEKRQMKTAEALGRALVLDIIVAWRVLLTCRLGQAHPHLPAGLLYSPEELAILEVIKKTPWLETLPVPASQSARSGAALPAPAAPQTCPPPTPALPQASPMTLFQANVLVAWLGGFWARPADGHPGPKMLKRGLVLLHQYVQWERLKRTESPQPKPRSRHHRQPG
jgi:hypothetical protein